MISPFTQCLFKASNAPHRKRVACQFVYIRKNTFAGSSPLQISLVKMTFLCGSHHKKVVYHFDRKSTKNTFCPLQPLPYKALFARRQLGLPYISPFFFTSITLHQGLFRAKRLIVPSFFRLKVVNAQVAASASRLRRSPRPGRPGRPGTIQDLLLLPTGPTGATGGGGGNIPKS